MNGLKRFFSLPYRVIFFLVIFLCMKAALGDGMLFNGLVDPNDNVQERALLRDYIFTFVALGMIIFLGILYLSKSYFVRYLVLYYKDAFLNFFDHETKELTQLEFHIYSVEGCYQVFLTVPKVLWEIKAFSSKRLKTEERSTVPPPDKNNKWCLEQVS